MISRTFGTNGCDAFLLAAVLLVLCACGRADEGSILVFGATSLKEALTEIGQEYSRRTGVEVIVSSGGSQFLAQQIASGAPADVFIAAGPAPMEFLESRRLVDVSSIRDVLGNELVVVALDEGLGIDELEDLLDDRVSRIAVADPDLAPAGSYARAALESRGIWDLLVSKTLLAKDVRAAMSYVAMGNADAGIVYRTDAASAPNLRIVYAVPAAAHPSIRYPAGVLTESASPDRAAAFLEFLVGEAAAAEFRSHGFVASR